MIDKLIHEPARLQLVASLYVVDAADFVFLLRQTGLTGGNVSSHMSKLEEAGYVDVEKGFVGKRPQTVLRSPALKLTPQAILFPSHGRRYQVIIISCFFQMIL